MQRREAVVVGVLLALFVLALFGLPLLYADGPLGKVSGRAIVAYPSDDDAVNSGQTATSGYEYSQVDCDTAHPTCGMSVLCSSATTHCGYEWQVSGLTASPWIRYDKTVDTLYVYAGLPADPAAFLLVPTDTNGLVGFRRATSPSTVEDILVCNTSTRACTFSGGMTIVGTFGAGGGAFTNTITTANITPGTSNLHTIGITGQQYASAALGDLYLSDCIPVVGVCGGAGGACINDGSCSSGGNTPPCSGCDCTAGVNDPNCVGTDDCVNFTDGAASICWDEPGDDFVFNFASAQVFRANSDGIVATGLHSTGRDCSAVTTTGTFSLGAVATNYMGMWGQSGFGPSTTPANVDQPTPRATVYFHSLYVRTDTAPDSGGGTQSWTFTLFQDGSGTPDGGAALTCTISEAAVSCFDDVNIAQINQNSLVNWQILPTGTPDITPAPQFEIVVCTNS